MIKITDKVETIELNKNELKYYDKFYEGYQIIPVFSYFVVELIIVVEENFLKEIIKINSGGEEILDRFPSKEELKDTIVLSPGDFKRFKRLYKNLRNKRDYRKEAIINAYAELLSCEYYQATVLEDISSITKEELFNDLNDGYNYGDYQEEILKKSQELLEKHYKVE